MTHLDIIQWSIALMAAGLSVSINAVAACGIFCLVSEVKGARK